MTMKKHGQQTIADFYQQFQAHVQMCEEMDVQLYEPALALSVMMERGGTFVTDDDKQSAHRLDNPLQCDSFTPVGMVNTSNIYVTVSWMERTFIRNEFWMPSP